MRITTLTVMLALLVAGVLPAGDAKVGEFSIPPVQPLQPAQRQKLRSLAQTDPEAKALAEEARKEALPLLDITPQPLKVTHYEGLVNTDPRRIATVEKLSQMGDAARLMRYWQVSGDDKAAGALKRLILAWTGTYELTGNDVNENKFYPLLVAYEALQDTVDDAERKRVDVWVEELGKLHKKAVAKSTHFTNRYSKHVRLLAICGMILDRDDWIAESHEGIKRFVKNSLRADGTSLDLERRDTLTYHASSLRPPLELAMMAGPEGRKLYTWTSPDGGSLQKSVDYVVPFAMGEKTRKEWTNSKVGLDKRRAEAGLEHYRSGKLYDPKDALKLMQIASYFDPELLKVVKHLTESDAKRFPTWQTLVNEAARAGG